MFTPDGDLRDEYKELSSAPPPSTRPEARPEVPPPAEPQRPAARRPGPGGGEIRGPGGAPISGAGPAGPAGAQGQPSSGGAPIADSGPADDDEELASGAVFEDLVALLGQTASVYLRQASQQLENRAEHLEMARMHIDLLMVLERKTRGNLAPPEKAMLDDAIYQLRMAFVEVGG